MDRKMPDPEYAAQLPDDLLSNVVRLYMAGLRGPKRIADALTAEAEFGEEEYTNATPELLKLVTDIYRTRTFVDAVMAAKASPAQFVQKMALDHAAMALQTVIRLAGSGNPDKRTRTANAQFLVSAGAGVSPTQRHEISAVEDFKALKAAIFPPMEKSDAPE
jgi:hypothetical protein